MKYYLNVEFLSKNDIDASISTGGTHMFLLMPFLERKDYFEFNRRIGDDNDAFYNKLYYSKDIFYTKANTIEECDYSVIPFKLRPNDSRVNSICNQALTYNKKVISFYSDDDHGEYDLPENLILFRTSLLKSKKHKNERVMPHLIADNFYGFTDDIENSIGFCGLPYHGRSQTLEKIKKKNIKTNIIYRRNSFAQDIGCEIEARRQFHRNLSNNKYTFCMRGNGNSSIRFYEALNFGRIPILIDTDTELPFSKIINWENHIIKINQNEIDNLPKLLEEDNRSMLQNRLLWEEYFSPHGYAKNFHKDI